MRIECKADDPNEPIDRHADWYGDQTSNKPTNKPTDESSI